MKEDIRIENSAKAVIVERDKVLLIRYEDTTEFSLGTWYSLPGGRQHFGESIEEALIRECKEEIGARVEIERFLFIREYIHARHMLKDRGRNQHKIEFMFLCSLQSSPAQHRAADLDIDQSAIVWEDLDALEDLQIFPTGLRRLKSLLADPTSSTYWGDVF